MLLKQLGPGLITGAAPRGSHFSTTSSAAPVHTTLGSTRTMTIRFLRATFGLRQTARSMAELLRADSKGKLLTWAAPPHAKDPTAN